MMTLQIGQPSRIDVLANKEPAFIKSEGLLWNEFFQTTVTKLLIANTYIGNANVQVIPNPSSDWRVIPPCFSMIFIVSARTI